MRNFILEMKKSSIWNPFFPRILAKRQVLEEFLCEFGFYCYDKDIKKINLESTEFILFLQTVKILIIQRLVSSSTFYKEYLYISM